MSSEPSQDRRDVVNAVGDAGSTRPGGMPTQVQVSTERRGTPHTHSRRSGIPKDWVGLQLSARTPHSPGPALPSEMGHNPQHLRGIFRSAGITDTLDFARLQTGHLIFLGGYLNAHSPLWNTYQPSDTRGEQLGEWVITHSATVLNDGSATLLNRATGGLSSPDVSLVHPFFADKVE